jgi:hypothetical protein
MKKEMLEINITTNEGMIFISQPDPYNDYPPIIINPDQVPILIKWLEEAKAEIEGNTTN